MQKSPLLVSSLVFIVIAIGHLTRYVLGWDLTINENQIPLQGSLIAGIVTALLALWTFRASRTSKPDSTH